MMKNGRQRAGAARVRAVETSACGRLATMPAKMISEMPLPTPRAVICSPSHIRNMVPPTSVITQDRRKNMPGIVHRGAEDAAHALQPDGDAPGLEHRDQHRQVAGILVELLAARLAFLLQGLERGDGGRHQLDDDAGGDVGHDVQREHRHAPERAAGEHVEHAEDAAAMLGAGSRPSRRHRRPAPARRCRCGRRSAPPG